MKHALRPGDGRARDRPRRCSSLLALGPAIFNDYWVNTILTQMFIFGIAAASLIFLSAYGAMTSLAQTALMGICALPDREHGHPRRRGRRDARA